MSSAVVSAAVRAMRATDWLFVACLVHSIALCVDGGKAVGAVDDLSLRSYSDVGELLQVAYASKAVRKSTNSALGFILRGTELPSAVGILLSFNEVPSRLAIKSKRSFDLFENRLAMATVGLAADCDQLRMHSHVLSQVHQLKFGYGSMSCYGLSSKVAAYLTRALHPTEEDNPIARPMAASAFICGYFCKESAVKLLLVESTGLVEDCQFSTLGGAFTEALATSLRSRVRAFEESRSPRSGADVRELLLAIVGEVRASVKEVHACDAMDVECVVVGEEGVRCFADVDASGTKNDIGECVEKWLRLSS